MTNNEMIVISWQGEQKEVHTAVLSSWKAAMEIYSLLEKNPLLNEHWITFLWKGIFMDKDGRPVSNQQLNQHIMYTTGHLI